MDNRTFADRFKVNCCPSTMAGFTNEEGPWNEDEQTIAAGLAWGEEKARLLRWVRWQMRWRLRDKQRQAIELHYFEDLTYVEIGLRMGCSTSAAYRSVRRGLAKLRESARQEGVGWSVDS
jgi:DNA-directed RNA polymerase specialized sigma24 family protein